jgi:hypothetical protein
MGIPPEEILRSAYFYIIRNGYRSTVTQLHTEKGTEIEKKIIINIRMINKTYFLCIKILFGHYVILRQ